MKNTYETLEKEEQNKKFFNLISGFYDKGIIQKILFRIIKKTVDEIEIKKMARILDAGTGSGNLLYLLSKQDQSLKLYGVDISEKMISIAEKKVKKAEIKLVSVVSIDKKFKKNFFDYVFVIDAFHHFPEHKRVMRNLYAILKKDGSLIITELDFGSILNGLFHLIEPGNTYVYTKQEMLALFREVGFNYLKQKRIGWFSVITIGKKIKIKGDKT